jgi:flagellar hook-associated protein 2
MDSEAGALTEAGKTMSSVSAVNTLQASTTTNSAISVSSILAAVAGTSTSAIDVSAAVTAGIYAARAPERAWQADQTTLSSQTTALTSIQTATEALATDMQNLNTLTGPLAARIVASSNSNDLTATAATGTVTGTHAVVVSKLASTESWYSDLQSSSTATLPISSLTLTTAAGASATFATGSGKAGGDNLNDLAKAINTANLGVNATVVSDASGSRLAIVSNTSGSAAGFSVTSSNYTGTSWKSPDIPTGATLGVNTLTLTSAAGTVNIATTSGETYAQLATAINNATIPQVPTSYTSTQGSLAADTQLTAGSVTSITDNTTGKTFSFTAASGDTVDDLNNAIATAVSAGTLPANIAGTVTSGNEVISGGSAVKGITVSTNDSVLGAMNAPASIPLGLTATAGSDANGTNLTVASSNGVTPFTINEPAFGFTEAVAAANASLTVDGVPIQSASNTVTGAISGVTLSLLGAAPGSPISLTVASDASQVSTAINQFVSDYNTAIGLVTAQFSVDKTTNSQGVLGTDPTVVSLQSTLEQAMNYVAKPATGTTTVTMLSDLGITANQDTGVLSVDSATLNNALTNNPTDVRNFFEGTALNGFANSVYNALNDFTSPANGAFKVDLSSIAATNTSLTSQINDFETGYIANQQTVLTAEYSQAETALQGLSTKMAQINALLGLTSSSK